MIDRRFFVAGTAASLAAPAFGRAAAGKASPAFPAGFLWGAATAGHQIEGNDTNSDYWVLENVRPTLFTEPSGDANNSFELWSADLDLARAIGLNAYRFSIEWSRIEPEPGLFSQAMLDHYKAIIAGCHARGLAPVVTFSHWAVPRWFAMRGGWTAPDSASLFARYCDRAARHLADGMAYAVTLNEANGTLLGYHMAPPQAHGAERAMLAAAARATGREHFVGGAPISLAMEMQPNLIAAHRQGRAAIKAARPGLPVGASLALVDLQGVGPNNLRDARRRDFYAAWLTALRGDDFVGVQNYSRIVWDAKGIVPVPAGARTGGEGWEIYPSSLANAVDYVHAETGCPILVTEHGLNTDNDAWRSDLITAALAELKRRIDAGTPVLGYLHWSLVDNFEWTFGYKPHYGLAAIDRETFVRKPRPSAAVLGAIARRNSL
ncbi:glycoside hydrolase family 1 protein [Novosphingobium flavum]|uniref:Glycoside hydrolase family 1 protein n=1 Tax=Novosphingobium flavum TaxID=1778672 RepID=A0A7X1FR68_9SPHN|nr:glycoside hydrolase family 1 protein [Novosphingobium flavum]